MVLRLFKPRIDLPQEMELRADIRLLESRVEYLRDELARRESRIEALQAELAEAWRVAAVNERLTVSMRRSVSWMITAPLRECRRAALLPLKLLGVVPRASAGTAGEPRRRRLRDRLRRLEQGVRRYRKSIAARVSAAPVAAPILPLTGRAREVHDDIVRAVNARRAA